MDLEKQPGHLARRYQQIAVAIFMEETADFAMTPPQFAALVALATHPDIDQRRLADAIAIDRSTIADLVSRLEARALVERRTGDDRRTKLVRLTASGKALTERLAASVERAQRRMLEPLSPAQQASFLALLGTLVAHHNDTSRAPLRALHDASAAASARRSRSA